MNSVDSTPPRIVQALGALAVVPFIAGAILVWTADAGWHATVALALSAYAAVVIAFIGALHWGLRLRDPSTPGAAPRFAWGVVPSIVAWMALLLPPHIGLVIDAAMLVLCFAVDRATYPRDGVAGWLPFRFRLTLVATLCCVAGALGS